MLIGLVVIKVLDLGIEHITALPGMQVVQVITIAEVEVHLERP
jgi:hypothetical protein